MLHTLTLLLVQDPLWTTHGNSAGDENGFSVAGCGDVNGDGRVDVLAGARFDAPNGFKSGSAAVLSGADGSLLHFLAGDSTGDELGFVVSGAGDFDGDGVPELLAGAPNDDRNGADSGSVFVYSGASGALLRILSGDAAGDHFGWSVTGCGDMNFDGVADLAAGAPDADPRGLSSGAVYFYSGASGTRLGTRPGDAAGDALGWSVAALGDSNGDGIAEIVAGAPFAAAGGANAGSVYLLAPGLPARRVNGAAAGALFGWSVAGNADLDGDGVPDAAAGAPSADGNGTDSGSMSAISGAAATLLWTVRGDGAFDQLGYSVAVLGPGRAAAGAYQDDNHGLDSGSARIYDGAGETLHTFNGDAPVDWLGWSVGAAGDDNAVGVSDFVAGIKRSAVLGDRSGSVRVFALEVFVLGAPVPGMAGQSNTVTLNGATPNADVTLYYGFTSGVAAVAGCPGLTLDMADPTAAAVARADAAGTAAWSARVPSSFAGRRILLQAVEAGRCLASNRVAYPFP